MGRSKSLSAFGQYLSELCREAGTTPFALAKASKCSPSVMTYAMRKRAPGVKAYAPPLKYLKAWCESLGVTGQRRQRFMVLAWLEHSPEPLREYVAKLEREIGEYRR
jgi:hypothetical protein